MEECFDGPRFGPRVQGRLSECVESCPQNKRLHEGEPALSHDGNELIHRALGELGKRLEVLSVRDAYGGEKAGMVQER